METLFDLSGKIALVTGGARGLGRAIALGLAHHGSAVAIVDRERDGAEVVAGEIRGLGRGSAAFACDVGEEGQVRATVAAAEEALGPIDILVNNAGITKRIALFDWQPSEWEEVIRVNQVGTFLVAREVGRRMVERGRGSIVNMSALGGGVVGLGRGNAVYCSTKGAVAALTRDLAAEWARFGVRVNAIAPGWFKTEMNAPLLKNPPLVDRIVQRVPLRRLGEPIDVVGPVVFLASDASAMITGHLLPIDGGASAIISLSDEPVVR
jgi:NAD(P)-dependent dehydrogenase (short-subunit alcohol dehydrogenase family)